MPRRERPRVAELLIEIGFEEMPAPWLGDLGRQLRSRFAEAAEKEHLAPRTIEAFWTPRRLVLHAEVAGRQPDREESVWGPSLKVAREADGRWTKAALGFARKSGVSVEELDEAPKDPLKPAELHLLSVRKTAGRDSRDVVAGLLPSLLRGLSFAKRMSWDAWIEDGRGAFPFGRPIRWLVVLLDGRVVPFAIDALHRGGRGSVLVESGAATRGHRFLPRGRTSEAMPVSSFAALRDGLRDHCVVLDPEERLARITAGLQEVGAGPLLEDRGLREEWRDLVEYPTVVAGTVPDEFRALPSEVLETVLVHHQKYIPLRSAGRVGRFAAVVNGEFASTAEIVRGMERVVVARLRDAAFFLGEDRRRPLHGRVSDLAGVTFHKGLGSYRDKAERLVRLVRAMGEAGVLDAAARAAAEQAARLAKADLTTLMVREFPELQGVMGGIYLEGEKAAPEVAVAVRWHYHPVAVEPEAPPASAFAGRDSEARVFAAVALADKLDTLAGYFGLGESPTGSRDPFALRRAAQGAVRAVLDFWRPSPGEPSPDLHALLGEAIEGYDGTLPQPPDETSGALTAFLLDRLESVLGARGFTSDEVAAVLHAPDAVSVRSPSGPRPIRALADPIDAARRLAALSRVRREVPADFEALAAAFKRAKNILTQQKPAPRVEAKLFEADAERDLDRAVTAALEGAGSYDEQLRRLAGLRPAVDRFFDDVLVMAEDAWVRANRLALLETTLSLFYRIADISRLGGSS
jgi:glycyl-tRNA synthetase beta chain